MNLIFLFFFALIRTIKPSKKTIKNFIIISFSNDIGFVKTYV